ncbi:hypothetical protein HOB30_00860 [Candidatus Falkowbacteria bacterium]|jgi:hypothetical protein|nr:hypothetical protein [Candidatus Falkowbacteria bacterium]
MKEIKLTHFITQDDSYVVYLGNYKKVVFKSKKTCLAFLAATSRKLTTVLHELNLIYSDCFTLYRSLWSYFDHNKNTRKAALYQNHRTIKYNLFTISDEIDNVVIRSWHHNSSVMTFVSYKFIITNLLNTLVLLNTTVDNKSIHNIKLKISHLKKQLSIIQSELLNIGVQEATEFLNADTDLEQLFEHQYVHKQSA